MKLARFCIVGDPHGDEINHDAAEKFFTWLDEFNPNIVIHGGDNWNMAALRKKASDKDKAVAIAPDYEAGTDFMRRLFAYGSTRVFTRGNHDERMYSFAQNCTDAVTQVCAAKLCGDTDALMRKLRVKVLPYDSRIGVLDIEGIRSIHGYAAGVSAARKFALTYGTCAFNHTHSMDVCPVEKWPEPAVAYGVGALLNIDQAYNSTQIGKLRHENGWLYGVTDGKRATYFQARFKDGKVQAAHEIKEY